MNQNQRQTLSWALFFTLMAFVSYYFVLVTLNVSNDFSEYTAFSDRLRGNFYQVFQRAYRTILSIDVLVYEQFILFKTVVILVGFIPLLFKSIIKKYSYYPFIILYLFWNFFVAA